VRYRFRINGKRIVYATDVELDRIFQSEYSPKDKEILTREYIDFIAKADLLIADGQFTAEEYLSRVGWGHSSIPVILDLASKAEVDQLAIFHHDPQHSDKFLDDLWTKSRVRYGGEDAKIRLQYSSYSDFSDDVHFVGEDGSSASIWNYADGAGVDNAVISSTTLPDAVDYGTHNESGLTASNFAHLASAAVEYEFTIRNNGAASGTVYYFRGYADYFSVYRFYQKPLDKNAGGYEYPSVTAGDSYVAFGISGIPQNTVTEGITTDINTSAKSITFGALQFDTPLEAAQRLEITTNAESGYRLYVKQKSDMTSNSGKIINPISHTNENPGNWPISSDPSDFGYHSGDYSLSGAGPSRFLIDDTYACLDNIPKEIGYNPLPVISDIFDFVLKMNVSSNQEAGDYISEIQYIIVPYY